MAISANVVAVPLRQTRSELKAEVVLPSLIIIGAFAGILFAKQRSTLLFLDGLHWTVAYIAAAWLAWSGVRTADSTNRTARRWFAVGLTSYAFGQVLLDLQQAGGWNPFPGPADFFNLWLGPCCAVGFFSVLREQKAPGRIRTALMDTGSLAIVVLALTLALYLPRRGGTGLWPLTVMVGYPLGLLTAACMGLILIPTLRARSRSGWAFFLGALLVNGGLWMKWNALRLDNEINNGTFLNALFSVTAMVMGVGAKSWNVTSSTDPIWERQCEGTLRQLPVLLVICVAIAVVLGWTVTDVPAGVQIAIGTAAVLVTALAMARQNLMLSDTDQLLRSRLESEQRFRTLVESAPEAIVVLDVEKGVFEDLNEKACRLFKMNREELLMKRPVELSPVFQADGRISEESAADKIRRAVGGESVRFEWTHRDSRGASIPCEVYLTRLPSHTRTLIRGSIIDITERRKLEEQFRQSQKMESIGRLAGGVAHDFNNILAVIQLQASQLGIHGKLSEEQAESATEISKAAERAGHLTRQLLLFSRQQALQPRDVDLNEIIGNIVRLLQRLIGEDIQLQLKYSPEPLLLRGDPVMMDQVLMNLTVNARDAMPKGGRILIETSAVEFDRITAGQSPQARPGSFVCLSVSDTGCGIPPETLPRIFEPFFTTKDVGKGTGLGLATVFGIIQQHQGWSNVYSEVGRGTTFRIYLPRLARNSDAAAPGQSQVAMRIGHETILLVEDDAALRNSLRTSLSQLGYRILEASTGVEALRLWESRRHEIALLFTDMVMPEGMTGRELAQRLLQDDPKLKVVYASGYSADISYRDLNLQEGVNFLIKPFEAHKLAEIVRNRLDEKP